MNFIFSDDTSFLTSDELFKCVEVVHGIERIRALETPAIARPQAGWADDREFQHADRTGKVHNFKTSYALLKTQASLYLQEATSLHADVLRVPARHATPSRAARALDKQGASRELR